MIVAKVCKTRAERPGHL